MSFKCFKFYKMAENCKFIFKFLITSLMYKCNWWVGGTGPLACLFPFTIVDKDLLQSGILLNKFVWDQYSLLLQCEILRNWWHKYPKLEISAPYPYSCKHSLVLWFKLRDQLSAPTQDVEIIWRVHQKHSVIGKY